MNRSHHDLSEAEDDHELREMLLRLKSLSPPLATRLANRAAVVNELSRLVVRGPTRSSPWWRRSIAVPVPIAAGLAALVLASLLLPQWAGEPRPSTKKGVRPAEAVDEFPGNPPMHLAGAGGSRRSTPVMEYYETEVYLCGVGRLSSESGYVIREQ
jgi:hypothetical protein